MRKGTRAKVAGQAPSDGHTDMRADPGMVLNYKAQEEARPQPAAPQPDLLDFDGLSMDAPAATGPQASFLLQPEANRTCTCTAVVSKLMRQRRLS